MQDAMCRPPGRYAAPAGQAAFAAAAEPGGVAQPGLNWTDFPSARIAYRGFAQILASARDRT
jgi:hypothetical protein